MIKSASDIWKEIATPNNLKFEFKTIAGVPVIVAKDFFKFPALMCRGFNKTKL